MGLDAGTDENKRLQGTYRGRQIRQTFLSSIRHVDVMLAEGVLTIAPTVM
jgi:hypothetical protein